MTSKKLISKMLAHGFEKCAEYKYGKIINGTTIIVTISENESATTGPWFLPSFAEIRNGEILDTFCSWSASGINLALSKRGIFPTTPITHTTMIYTDNDLDHLSDAIHAIDNSGNFMLDDVCWSANGYTSVALAYSEPEVDYYQTLRVFDLTSPEWSPALLLLACLRLMFPERDCVALVTLRNKLFDKYYK